MTLPKGMIFNIQKFSITDGVGIRTLVFMKGCPLRCIWCSNPESQKSEVEIMDVKSNCVGCGKCAEVCSVGAISKGSWDIDREKCTRCGKCTECCYANAKKTVGKEYSLVDVMKIIEKDRVFYKNSGGGVTVGGGEPTMQPEFVSELLRCCKATNIHTAIETCGFGNWETIKPIFEYTDQVFFDLKAMDSDIHRELTGVGNEVILENAVKVAEMGKRIIFRVPVIPGLNDSESNLQSTARFVEKITESTDSDISIELLPYHNFGRDKYRWINEDYSLQDLGKPDEKRMSEYKQLISGFNIDIIS